VNKLVMNTFNVEPKGAVNLVYIEKYLVQLSHQAGEGVA
jgi:hypothetical protein